MRGRRGERVRGRRRGEGKGKEKREGEGEERGDLASDPNNAYCSFVVNISHSLRRFTQ